MKTLQKRSQMKIMIVSLLALSTFNASAEVFYGKTLGSNTSTSCEIRKSASISIKEDQIIYSHKIDYTEFTSAANDNEVESLFQSIPNLARFKKCTLNKALILSL